MQVLQEDVARQHAGEIAKDVLPGDPLGNESLERGEARQAGCLSLLHPHGLGLRCNEAGLDVVEIRPPLVDDGPLVQGQPGESERKDACSDAGATEDAARDAPRPIVAQRFPGR